MTNPTNLEALEVLAAQRGDETAERIIRRAMETADGCDAQRMAARIIGLAFDGENATVNQKLESVK